MLRRDIAGSSLKVLCENFNSVKSYGKTNMTIFFIKSMGKKTGWAQLRLAGLHMIAYLNVVFHLATNHS